MITSKNYPAISFVDEEHLKIFEKAADLIHKQKGYLDGYHLSAAYLIGVVNSIKVQKVTWKIFRPDISAPMPSFRVNLAGITGKPLRFVSVVFGIGQKIRMMDETKIVKGFGYGKTCIF